MAEVLNVALRNEVGTRAVRRLRKAGYVPAVLYGHKQDCVNLSVADHDLRAVLRHGSHLVDLTGDLTETALIKDVQWDTFSIHVLHVDLTRVAEGERVTVTVALEFRGESPGGKKGGIVEHLAHEVEIECPAAEIPDKLVAHVTSLDLGGTLTAAAVELPANVTLVTDSETAIAHCLAKGVEAEEEGEIVTPAGPSEPEVIGRKAEAEGEGEAGS